MIELKELKCAICDNPPTFWFLGFELCDLHKETPLYKLVAHAKKDPNSIYHNKKTNNN